jgi:hypothetical protein
MPPLAEMRSPVHLPFVARVTVSLRGDQRSGAGDAHVIGRTGTGGGGEDGFGAAGIDQRFGADLRGQDDGGQAGGSKQTTAHL